TLSRFYVAGHHRDPPSFPTRRSSDLALKIRNFVRRHAEPAAHFSNAEFAGFQKLRFVGRDADGFEALPRFQHTQPAVAACTPVRSEEHTSELQSRENLVCRLLLEKKK